MKTKYFLISTLAILLFYVMMVHPFEVPDENAHYSSLNFLYNEGRMPKMTDSNNLSLEELETENIASSNIKTNTVPGIQNEICEGLVGIYENEIVALNSIDTYHPDTFPGRHLSTALLLAHFTFYYLVTNSDILMRLFVSRFSSIILTVMLVLWPTT
jgi:hypothetical protein